MNRIRIAALRQEKAPALPSLLNGVGIDGLRIMLKSADAAPLSRPLAMPDVMMAERGVMISGWPRARIIQYRRRLGCILSPALYLLTASSRGHLPLSRRRGVVSISAISSNCSALAGRSSLNLRAEVRTFFSREPTVWL